MSLYEICAEKHHSVLTKLRTFVFEPRFLKNKQTNKQKRPTKPNQTKKQTYG